MSEDLPPGWVSATVGELAEVLDSRRIPLNQAERAKRPGPYPYFGANGQVGTINGYLFDGRHILLAEDGGYFDDPFRPNAYEVDGKFWVNNHAHILRAGPAIEHGFLLHALNATDLMPFVSGTTRLKLTQADMRRIPVAVPPLAEQRRIVARIEVLFARTRQARADLLRIAPLSERYRARAIAAPFGSEATVAWPRRAINEIVVDARIGLVRSKEEQSTVGEVPYIRMQHYDHYGRWNADNLTFVAVSPAELTSYELRAGDLLFNTRNSAELVGKLAIWPAAKPGHVYNNNLLRLRFRQNVAPAFVRWSLVGSDAAATLHGAKSATTSVAAIYQRDLMALRIGVPSLAEQQRIAAEISASMQAADQIEVEATRVLALLDHLERSILTRAFRGELVPQDPADEPASVALARLGGAQAAPQRRRGRRAA